MKIEMKNEFRNNWTLRLRDKRSEEEFNTMRYKLMVRLNPWLTVVFFLVAAWDTLYESLIMKWLAEHNKDWRFATSYLSYVCSGFAVLNLILVFVTKNRIVQAYVNYSNYLFISFPLFLTRGIMLNTKDADSNVYALLFVLEYVGRISWVFLLMLIFTEACILNLMIIVALTIYSPVVSKQTTVGAFNIPYNLFLILFTVICYFYTRQVKKNFHYNLSLQNKNKWYTNILENMNSGFIYIKDGKISYVNNIIFEKMLRNKDIKQIIGHNSIVMDILRTERENNILIKNDYEDTFNPDEIKANMNNPQIASKILDVMLTNISCDNLSKNNIKTTDSPYNDGNPIPDEIGENMFKNQGKYEINTNANEIHLKVRSEVNEDRFSSETFLKGFKNLYLNNKEHNEKFILLGYKDLENEVQEDGEVRKETINFEIFCRFYYNSENEISEDFELIFNDVTRTKIVEEKNAEFKYKSLFLSKIAHEFKNPLICITELIDQIYDKLEEKKTFRENKYSKNKKGLENNVDINFRFPNKQFHDSGSFDIMLNKSLPLIKSLSNYLLILVKDLDFFSQSQIGKTVSLEMCEANLTEILDFCKEISKGLLKKNNKEDRIELILRKGSEVPKFIYTDDTKLKQILINLLSNAIKFTNQGYIKVEISKTIEEEKNTLLFEIADTGPGIPKDIQANLFKPFKKGYNKNNKIGAGLGLSIVSDLVNKLKGRINFKSSNEGTSFYISLPYEKQSSYLSEIINKNKNEIPIENLRESSNMIIPLVPGQSRQESEKSLTSIETVKLSNIILTKEPGSFNPSYVNSLFSNKTYSNPYNRRHFSSYSMDKYYKKKNSMKIFKHIIPLPEEMQEVFPNTGIGNVDKFEFQPGNDKLNFIIADDEPFARQNTIRTFTKTATRLSKSIGIIEAEDGVEVLYIIFRNFVKGRRITGIITDETMKMLKGSQSAEVLRSIIESEVGGRIPLFLLSAYEDKSVINNSQLFDAIFTKPLNQIAAEKVLNLNK